MTQWTEIEVTASGREPTSADLHVLFEDWRDGAAGEASPSVLQACGRAGFAAEQGRWLDIIGGEEGRARSLVLGAGAPSATDPHRWVALGGWLFDAMVALQLASVRLPAARRLGGAEALQGLLLGALLHSFRLECGYVLPRRGFRPQRLLIEPEDTACADDARRTAAAVNRVRAWVEQPANLLTPKAFAEECRELQAYGASVRILETAELEALGAGAILAVGHGAEHPPRLAVVEWRGAPEREGWDAALIGKGLTFDGGGLNLKARPVIEKMKFDMAGGAAVLGAIQLVASSRAPCNVVALVPMVENAIDALAYRPGDVITSLSGLTIEILNTDAEGRLVLADALTYGLRTYAPRYVVDVATLTGAITGVLHEEFAGYYSTDDELAAGLERAAQASGERVWRLPLDASQDYLVDSEVADVANLGAPGFLGLGAGSPTAGAKLLQRFVGPAKWAHIDIAGAAWSTRRTVFANKGATGYGVRLLVAWLSELAHAESPTTAPPS
jgi:leucyl aminopeptidase